eukprot:3313197-Amphidinium_carterae.1
MHRECSPRIVRVSLLQGAALVSALEQAQVQPQPPADGGQVLPPRPLLPMEEAMWGLLSQAGLGWDSLADSDPFGPPAAPPPAQLLQQPLATPIAQVAPRKIKASALIEQSS